MTLSRPVSSASVLAAVAAILLALFTGSPAQAATPDPQVPTAPVPAGRHDMALPHSPQLLARLRTTNAANATVHPALAGTQGIDVSAYQHPNGAAINWGAVAGAGYTFAAIKTTEGTYYTNPYFAADYAAAKQAGLYVAAYHFATPDTTDGTTQADYAVNHAQYAADGRTLPIELDIEYNPYGAECYGLSAPAMVGWVQAFSGEVQARTGRLPMIYSTADWWNTCTGGSTALGANPLWVAAYGTGSPPIPAGWSGYTFWQYTSTGSVPGISGNVDVSYFNGDTNGLAAFAGGSTAPPSRASSTVATSPQFGAGSQTDVFRIASDGTLEVNWVLGGGTWNGPLAISAAGFAPAGAQVVAINQFGLADQTDVFVVDKTGTLQVFWVQGIGNWHGPLAVSAAGVAPPGAALAASNQFGIANQTDVFVVNNAGTAVTYYVDGAGNWAGPHAISAAGAAPAGAALAASNQFGLAGQTDLFVVDSAGTVDVYWVVDAGNWNGPLALSAAGVAPAGAALAASNQFGIANQTDVFVVDKTGTLDTYYVLGGGNWYPHVISAAGAAPPGAALAATNQFGVSGQTDVMVADDNGTIVTYYVLNAGNWNGPVVISPGGYAPAGGGLAAGNQFGIPDQTDVFATGTSGTTNVFWVDNTGNWAGPENV